MAFKALLVICAQALLMKSAFSQILAGPGLAGGWNGLNAGFGFDGLAGRGLGAGCGCGGVASTGGGFPVASASPIPPVGVSVQSENVYEGDLCAGGNLPFLGTVGVEGVLPTAGAGAVSYGCGDGAIGIVAESPIATGITNPGTYAPGIGAINGLGYGAGLGGLSYGLAGPAGLGAGFGGAGCGCVGF